MAMGATTYAWVLDHDHLLDHPEKWQAFYGDILCWVFTHRTCRGFREQTSGSSGTTYARFTRP